VPSAGTSRPFLNRPFWRDWVLACVLIGGGFALFGPGHPYVNGTGYTLMLLGAGVFVAAIAHAIWFAFAPRPGRQDSD
jgi:hypothetical protein